MELKCGQFILGIALALLICQGIALSEGTPADTGPSQCRALGEEFSLGGIPGPQGWDQSQINCCPGLVDRERKEDYWDDCKSGGLAGGYVGRCIACGDGVCDHRFESKCICPEDCKT